MTVTAAQAAKLVGDASSWTLTNLSIQKLLYIAHMVFLGENDGQPLINESFEAWDYGPVVPQLYHRIKIFGNEPVKDVFYSATEIDNSSIESKTIKRAVSSLAKTSAGELVSITHRSDGAWAKHYVQGIHGIRIPNSDILEEYRKRFPDKHL